MKFLKIAGIVLAVLVLLVVGAVIFINLPSTKHKAANYLSNYLKNELGLRLETEDLDYNFEKGLIRIRMRNVRIYGGEANRELFFQTKVLEAIIPYSSLRGDHFLVNKVVLNSPDINLENLPRVRRKQTDQKSARTFEIQQIDFTGGGVRFRNLPIQDIDLVAQLKDNDIVVHRFDAKFDTVQAEGSAQVLNMSNPQFQVHFKADGNLTSVKKIVAAVPPLAGPFTTQGQLRGDKHGFVVEGKVRSDDVRAYGETPFPVNGTYRYDSASKLNPLKYAVEWKSAPATLARRFEPAVPQIASMTAGTFSFEGGKNFWQGSGAFEVDLEYAQKRGIPLAGQVRGELRDGAIRLSRSNVTTGSTQATFEGDVSRSAMDLNVSARVRDASTLAFLTPQLHKIPGSYQIQSRILGPYRDLRIQWNLRGTAPEVRLVASGAYRLPSRHLTAAFQGQADAQALQRLYPTDMSGDLLFEGNASGPITRLSIDANVHGKDLIVKGVQVGEAIVDVQSDGRVLNLDAQLPAYSTTASGSYRLATKQFNASFKGDTDVARFEQFYSGDLQGNVAFEGTASGSISNPVIDADLHGTDLVVNGTRIGEATVDLQSDGRVLNASAEIPDHTTSVRGSYQFRTRNFQVDGSTTNLNVATFRSFLPANVREAEGTFSATFHASGDARHWKDAEAHVELANADFKYRDYTAEIDQATADLRDGTATVDLEALTSHGTFEARGTIPVFRQGEMDLDIAGQTDLKFISLLRPELSGEGPLTVDAHLGGTFQNPDYSGRVSAENFSLRSPDPAVDLNQGNVVAEFLGGEIAVRGSAVVNGSALSVDGRVPLANKAGFVHLTLDRFALAPLAPDANVAGTISVEMDAHGIGRNLESWSGHFKILPHQVVVAGRTIEAPEPLDVEMTSGRLLVNRIHLTSGEFLDAEAQGRINFKTGQIEGVVRNQMNLSLLSGFMTNVAAEGNMLAEVHIGGTLKSPDLEGQVILENGMFRRFESPILLEQIQLRAPIRENQIQLQTFTARMGGGTVEGEGVITLENWKPDQVNLRFQARTVGMQYPEGLRSQLNADLTLTDQENDFLLSGTVQVVRSTYREDIDPRDRLVNSLISEKRALSSRTGPVQGRLHLDIGVETVEDFQMRNNMGRVQAGANLEVRGLLDSPRIFGRVRVRERSEIYFEGNQFEVQRGIIDFYGQRRLNPTFDVELFTIVMDLDTRQDYEITIPLSGELHDLDRRDPTSFPPLASNQIYFLLLTGRADAQLGTAGSRFFTQQLASFAAGQVFSDLTQNLARGFGLDRVEIQPEMLASETNPGAKLVLGKDFTSALSLMYSISLTEAREQTWIANYKAPKNLSFRFVDQAEGSYTANMRHLIRFGQGVSTGTLRPRRQRETKVERIEIQNDSVLSTEEILKELDIEAGDTYDFWTLQDQLEDLEEILQERGILFSSTQSEESQAGQNRVVINVKVTGTERREMTFQGWEVSPGQLENYRRLWREGFSPAGVTQLIREQLLRDLWLAGYHKAEVQADTSTQNGVTQHRFTVNPGTLYAETQIKLLKAEQYPADELEEDLRTLYEDSDELYSDAVHNFTSIERKIVALYVRRGFLETSVESGSLHLSPGLAVKEITVNEGAPSKIVDVVVSNNQELPDDLRARLKLKPGMVHDPQAQLEDEVAIGDYYERAGYRKAQIESSIENTPEGLILRYDLRKGEIAIIDAIQIEGATFTKESLIRKRLQLKEGEILNQDKIANAQKNLTDLRIFHQVSILTVPTPVDPNRYIIVADVIERNRYELIYGFRYDTETDVGGEVQLTDLNLFGTGQSISFYTRVHQQDQLYRILYHSPTLSGLRWKTLISTSYERGNLLLLENKKFDGERYDLTFQRQRNLPHEFLLIPGYEFEYLTLTPLETPNIQPVRGLKVSRFLGTLLRDTRDDPFNTTRGSFFTTDLQVAAGIIGDVSYVKNYNHYIRVLPYSKFTWASAVRVGLASDLPERVVTERFFAGGSFSIRGFKKDQVGPRFADGTPRGGEALFVLNQELRFPVWKWFGGAVFYDGGNVYSRFSEFNPFDIRHSVGMGLRVNSPFGIARLDYGINLSREDDEPRGVLHFALGQAF